jgi:hypothetical protein
MVLTQAGNIPIGGLAMRLGAHRATRWLGTGEALGRD